MRCPKCKERILHKAGDTTRLRVEGLITFDANGVCRAKCYWCKSIVEVPVKIVEGIPIVSERFYLKK